MFAPGHGAASQKGCTVLQVKPAGGGREYPAMQRVVRKLVLAGLLVLAVIGTHQGLVALSNGSGEIAGWAESMCVACHR
jgi:hypothetical protein